MLALSPSSLSRFRSLELTVTMSSSAFLTECVGRALKPWLWMWSRTEADTHPPTPPVGRMAGLCSPRVMQHVPERGKISPVLKSLSEERPSCVLLFYRPVKFHPLLCLLHLGPHWVIPLQGLSASTLLTLLIRFLLSASYHSF